MLKLLGVRTAPKHADVVGDAGRDGAAAANAGGIGERRQLSDHVGPGILWHDDISPLIRGVVLAQAAFRGSYARRRLRRIPSREVERAVRELNRIEKGCKRLFGFLLLMGLYFGAVFLQTEVGMQNQVELGMRRFFEDVSFGDQDRRMGDVTSIDDFWEWAMAFFLAAYQGRQTENVCNYCYYLNLIRNASLKLEDPLFYLAPSDCEVCFGGAPLNTTVSVYPAANSTKEYTATCADCVPYLYCLEEPCSLYGGGPATTDDGRTEPVTYRAGDLPATIAANRSVCLGSTDPGIVNGVTRNMAELIGQLEIDTADGLGYVATHNRVIGGMLIIFERRREVECEAAKVDDKSFYEPCFDNDNMVTNENISLSTSLQMYLPNDKITYSTDVAGYSLLNDLGLYNIGLGYGFCTLVAAKDMQLLKNDTKSVRVALTTYNGNKRTMYGSSQAVFDFQLGGQVKVSASYNAFMTRSVYPPANTADTARIVIEVSCGVLALYAIVHDVRKRKRRLRERRKKTKAFVAAAVSALAESRRNDRRIGGGGGDESNGLPRWKRDWVWRQKQRLEAKRRSGRQWCCMSSPSCICGCTFHFFLIISMFFWILNAFGPKDWAVDETISFAEETSQGRLAELTSSMASIQRRSHVWDAYRGVFLWTSLLGLLRLFHMMRFHRRLSLVSQTLRNSASHLAHFLFISLMVVMVYALAAWNTLGESLPTFSSLSRSIFTLLLIALGLNDEIYPTMVDARPVTGLLMALTYQIIMGLLIINVLVAIMIDAYRDYVDQLQSEETVWESFNAFWGVVGRRAYIACLRRRRLLRKGGKNIAGDCGGGDCSGGGGGSGGVGDPALAARGPSGSAVTATAMPAAAGVAATAVAMATYAASSGGGGGGGGCGSVSPSDAIDEYDRAASIVRGTDGKPVRLVRVVTPQRGSEMKLTPNCPKWLDCFSVRDLIAEGGPAPAFIANRRTRQIVHNWMFASRERTPEDPVPTRKPRAASSAPAGVRAGGDGGTGAGSSGDSNGNSSGGGALGSFSGGGSGVALPSGANSRSLAAGIARRARSDPHKSSSGVTPPPPTEDGAEGKHAKRPLHAAATALTSSRIWMSLVHSDSGGASEPFRGGDSRGADGGGGSSGIGTGSDGGGGNFSRDGAGRRRGSGGSGGGAYAPSRPNQNGAITPPTEYGEPAG